MIDLEIFAEHGYTPEDVVKFAMRDIAALMLGVCPDSGQPLVYDNPYSDAPRFRLSCDMCDCFGYYSGRSDD